MHKSNMVGRTGRSCFYPPAITCLPRPLPSLAPSIIPGRSSSWILAPLYLITPNTCTIYVNTYDGRHTHIIVWKSTSYCTLSKFWGKKFSWFCWFYLSKKFNASIKIKIAQPIKTWHAIIVDFLVSIIKFYKGVVLDHWLVMTKTN